MKQHDRHSGFQGRSQVRRWGRVLARWQGLVWRLGHVRKRAKEAAARHALQLMIWVPPLWRLPRKLMVAIERMVITAANEVLFDGALYLERNPDVRASGADPLAHYLRYGWAEGRSPNAWLDETRYRRQAGLAPYDHVSALGHYLVQGNGRMLAAKPGFAAGLGIARHPEGYVSSKMIIDEKKIDDETAISTALERLERVATQGSGKIDVDVIIPVYRGRLETLACLTSVLEAGNETCFAVVVVEDAGPDPALRADLQKLARRGLIDLLVQTKNRGFVAAVNTGMRQNPEHDVIWLNSDTEVNGDWIDRLRRAAYSAPNVATVTPLTNNGTICSYPRFDTINCEPLEVGWADTDRIAARVNAGRRIEAPTCVGFATYVRRDGLDQIGVLDEAAFGRGYGEENDYSQRAIKADWCNLIAGDVFVHHLGQTSFKDERACRVAKAMRVVERRHPGYRRQVAKFIAADPVAPLRQAIDLERLRLLRCGVPPAPRRRTVLVVAHSLGGGTRQHVDEEIARLTAGGAGVIMMAGGGCWFGQCAAEPSRCGRAALAGGYSIWWA